MGKHGIQSLDAGEALNVQLGALGFDEVDFTEHLTNGATVAASEWTGASDLKTASGNMSLTVTDEADKDLAAFFGGELTDALQILTPERNRIMTDGTANWANGNLANFSLTGNQLKAYGDAADEYFTLATQYAPMTAGQVYEMTLYASTTTWFGAGWDFQDFGGRDLILTADSPTKPGGGAFWCEDRPVNAVFKFTAPAGTSGGFKVKAHGGASEVKYFDNFLLVNTNAKEVVTGMVFKVTSTGDTTDNALQTAKGSAPANNDLFAITSKTTTGAELMPNVEDRDFSSASAWADVDLAGGGGAYDESGDLTLLAGSSGAGDYCTCPVNSAPMTAGTAYRIQCDVSGLTETWEIQDFTGAQVLGTISADGDDQTFDFQMDGGLTGGYRIVAGADDAAVTLDNFSLKAGLGTVAYVGNAVGSYALGETATKTSTLTQTASDRASAGLNAKGRNSKEYKLTYTIAVKQAIAPAGALALTVTTDFASASTTMPITAGAQAVYFKSASDASAADFVIQSVSTDATAGVLAISAITLFRCCDNVSSVVDGEGSSWHKLKAVEGNATVSAVAINGDDASSQEVLEGNILEGAFSRILGTSGIIHAYRVPYRSTDV